MLELDPILEEEKREREKMRERQREKLLEALKRATETLTSPPCSAFRCSECPLEISVNNPMSRQCLSNYISDIARERGVL